MDFFEGVPEKLDELKKRGFKLGIVTNTVHPPSEKIVWFTTVAIDKVWDSYADSCELGIGNCKARRCDNMPAVNAQIAYATCKASS